jgi:hypothetical protein
VIDLSSPFIRAPKGGTFHEKITRNIDLKHHLEGSPLLSEELSERFTLGYRARKSVQNEAILAVFRRKTLVHEADHHGIRD